MASTAPSRLLEQQHRRIDRGIQGVVDGTGELPALAEALALLQLHIYAEEQILFPLLEQARLTMPVFVMRREHGQMWPLLDGLSAQCRSAARAQTLRGACAELLQSLQMHNPKEELILYTTADRLAAEAADDALSQRLQAARMPPGWTCAMAPR